MSAKGFVHNEGSKKIAINMPEELFNKISQRAAEDSVSFNAKAVELLSCGVFDYEESEAHEPAFVPCLDGTDHHKWVVDDSAKFSYCEICGCHEY